MSRPGRDGLEARVAEALASRASGLGLRGGLSVEHLLNWGGFVNVSFHVTDGTRRCHVKLASVDGIAGLERWRELHEHLTKQYRAPAMLDWIRLDEEGLQGPVFEHLDAAPPPGALPPDLAEDVVALLARLHADPLLSARLDGTGDGTCLADYLGNHGRRFLEDLELVRASPPPFVGAAGLEWMEREVARLDDEVRGSEAFREAGDAPVHGDLWLNNLLVGHGGAWHVVDWDDLRLGDPMLDYATVLGPSPSDLRPVRGDALAGWRTLGAAEQQRLALYARATLLDWVIDPLADHVEAGRATPHVDEVRAEKERVHRAAKALYARLFP